VLVPFYSKNKEGITLVVRKKRGRDKIKSTKNEKVPKIRSMGKLLPNQRLRAKVVIPM
jgi:hypothetical protein